VIGCVYRSPNSSDDNAIAMNCVMDNIGQRNSPVLILGDFNYPTINLNDETATGVKKLDRAFQNTLSSSFLVQLVDRPTRYRAKHNPTMDDLVITNEED
jgi:hypothetical protein